MRAMQLDKPGRGLREVQRDQPEPGPGELLLHVHVCGVCRTDLHIVDGELDLPRLPVVPGHQVVATVVARGPDAPPRPGEPETEPLQVGQRVGVPWLGWTCGECRYCRSGRENLCDRARFTGLHVDGGYEEMAVAAERFCFPLPDDYGDLEVAPLLCGGLIGHRALRMTGDAERLGLFGFGSSAHIVAQVARWQGRRVFAFTKPGDTETQEFARSLGAKWAGGVGEPAPDELDAAIIFAPAGELVPAALRACAKGGVVVCAGIHMSDIPSFPYDILWGERSIRSVANLTRQDGVEFLDLAPRVPVRTTVTTYPLERTNDALDAVRRGTIEGSAAVIVDPAATEARA
jgi:propanol-preferring alcohol dehydrogenase